MPRLTRDEHLFGDGPKRILALDGGGIRGMFTLQILHKIEAMVRQRTHDPAACLADYFDLIGGTSTGAVIASGLALGWSVNKLENIYNDLGKVIFRPDFFRRGVIRAKFPTAPLNRVLAEEFGDITLGDRAIRTGLAIITKRIDTGSTWVLFNNPKSRFFEQDTDSTDISNKDYRLRQVIRASSAAPHFFAPERIAISSDIEGAFVDGGVSPHNNPALQMLLLATLDGYRLNWPVGSDNLFVVSVGTGLKALEVSTDKAMKMTSAEVLLKSLESLMDDTSHLNELLLQMLSDSPTAREIDMEVGCAKTRGLPPWITYLRYNATLEQQWLHDHLGITEEDVQVQKLLAMDDPNMLETFAKIGQLTADKFVREQHFPSHFDIEPEIS